MPIHLPHLTGEKLAALRRAFGLLQADLSRETNCAISTIQKAEAAATAPIGPALARALAPHLVGARDVMLELALTLPAVEKATQQGVLRWRTPVGDCWWLPQIKAWRQRLALETHRTFGSIDSMARFLCARLGISEDEGVLLCDSCDEAGVTEPSAAWRACAKCGKFLCGSEECGRYILTPTPDARESPPVLCRACVRQATKNSVRRPDPLLDIDRVTQLSAMWSDLRSHCSQDDAYHNGFLIIIEDELEEADARVNAIRQVMRKWGPRPHHNLEAALEEAVDMRRAFRELHERVSEFRR